MEITADFLKAEIASLKRQAEAAQATSLAALGAVQAYEALVARLETPGEPVTLKQLGETLDGTAEEPVPLA